MRVPLIVWAAVSAAMLLVAVGLGQQDARAAGSARVQISPASSYVQSGSTVDLYVEVQNYVDEAQGLGLYEFRLTYDPTVLEFVGVANLSFLGSTGRPVTCDDASNPATATVDYHCNSTGLTPAGPTGSGQLAQMRFKGVAPGESPLHFTKLELGVELGSGIAITDYGEATVRVGDTATDNSNSGGGGGGSAATPTKVPGALTPTIPPNAGATPIPTLGNDVYDPDCAGQGECNLGTTGGDVGPTGTTAGTSSGVAGSTGGSGSSGGTGAAGTGAPVAGSGPPPGEDRVPAGALQMLVLAGGLLIFTGVMIARKTREA